MKITIREATLSNVTVEGLPPDKRLEVIDNGDGSVSMLLTGVGAPPGGDDEAPILVSAVVNEAGNQIVLTFSEPVKYVDEGGITVTANGGPVPTLFVDGGESALNPWTGNFLGTVTAGQTVLVSYAPGTVQDASGNLLAAFSDFPATNNSTQ